MDQPRRDTASHFSQPVRQILSMIVVLGLVGFGAYVAAPRVAPVFLANPYLNGFIAFVFAIGVLACFWQVLQLIGSVRWIEGFVSDRPGHEMVRAPRLLAPLASLLRARRGRMQIGAASARSILDSVATRIDEARDITRYITNLLIFLGLLGTFYGLATTVPALVETIRSLAPREGEGGLEVFNRLMGGLEAQLGGMGIAFASSLLGLAGSLVVGLLELFASHGQSRFYRELEEWMSTITRVGLASGDGEGSGEGGGQVAAVLDHMAGQIETLQTLYASTAEARAETDARLARVADAVERLADRLQPDGEGDAMARLAEGQSRLADLMERQLAEGGGALDGESRMRLRSLDVQLLRILEELSAGRQETLADLRGDLAQLTEAVRHGGAGRPADVATPFVGRRG